MTHRLECGVAGPLRGNQAQLSWSCPEAPAIYAVFRTREAFSFAFPSSTTTRKLNSVLP